MDRVLKKYASNSFYRSYVPNTVCMDVDMAEKITNAGRNAIKEAMEGLTISEYIIFTLNRWAQTYPYIQFKYAYDKNTDYHIVEVTSGDSNKNDYKNDELMLYDDVSTYYPESAILITAEPCEAYDMSNVLFDSSTLPEPLYHDLFTISSGDGVDYDSLFSYHAESIIDIGGSLVMRFLIENKGSYIMSSGIKVKRSNRDPKEVIESIRQHEGKSIIHNIVNRRAEVVESRTYTNLSNFRILDEEWYFDYISKLRLNDWHSTEFIVVCDYEKRLVRKPETVDVIK